MRAWGVHVQYAHVGGTHTICMHGGACTICASGGACAICMHGGAHTICMHGGICAICMHGGCMCNMHVWGVHAQCTCGVVTPIN